MSPKAMYHKHGIANAAALFVIQNMVALLCLQSGIIISESYHVWEVMYVPEMCGINKMENPSFFF